MVQSVRGRREGRGGRYRKLSIDEGRGAQAQPPLLHLRDNVVDISSDDSIQSPNVGLDDTIDDGNAAHRNVDIEGDNVVDISSDDSTQSLNVGLDDTMDDGNAAHRSVDIEGDNVVDISSDDSTQSPNVGLDDTMDDDNAAHRRVEIEDMATRKRGRGPAKGTEFERLHKLGKIPLNIKDGQRGPSCENYAIFSGRVTMIVRLHANMRHASWTMVGKEEKDDLIDRVRADFVLDWTQSSHRECVTNTLARKYNAFHCQLHKVYLGYATHEEALSGGTSWVEKPVWEVLCERWSSQGFKELSKRNRKNRQKQLVNHTGGRKSFVRIMEEKCKQAPNLVAFYKEVHWSKKKSRFITETAEHNYNLMVERLNERDLNENIDEAANAVFKEVLGQRSGYARGLGYSVTPESSLSLRNNKDYQRISEENEKNKNRADLYKSKLEALKTGLLEFRKWFQDYEKRMNSRLTKLDSLRESHKETPVDV
ncbi:uncharacterized protein LOC122307003 isoform X2 [Carya illinoinensis]|nr:uncharacterized protein LOC122307003 isoform X2 [Carya illinoinensis]XP_042975530.1 uncharacterized protein LOC122307003 isoform X2 [Carya illinoinensis]